MFLLVLLAVFVSAYSVFWGEFVHCDVGTCPYPNPEGRFLSIDSTSIVFDTSGDPSAMGFYVVAVVLDKHASLSISGWWSYQLPRTMAYVVSDKGFSAMECSTGGGQVCSVSGVLSPGVYYIVLVDAWAQQTVRVTVSDGQLVLADVSPQRVACALWRAGVLAGQRLTYAFHWPSRPGVSISQDVVDSSCGPPALQEALAFAAVFGLDAGEASLLVRPFGYNVTSVERRFGSVVFRLQPDLTYVVPLVFDVQLGGQGRLLLVNPSNATVRWAVEVHLSNKSGVGSPKGPPVMSFDVVVPPRSAKDFYLYGSAGEEGFYVLSYRLRVLNESASWGGSSFYVRNRLATQNGSVLNFLWGLGELVVGAVWRDRCLSARGAGRMWAASKLGLAGVATEADVAAGVYSLFATGGSLLGVKLGESAAKASSSAVRLAGRLAAAGRAIAYVDLLAHGVLLGWDAYLDVSSGRIPWGEVADAALLAAGPVAARVKPLAAVLAGGGAVMLYLGEPLNLSASFAEELYAAASEYGEYADCFVAGALQAFSTYAQEVEAARWVGIASSFVDVASLLNNKHWLGYRQLAALAAFDYKTPGPIFTSEDLLKRVGGSYQFVFVGKRKIGVDQGGSLRLYYIGSERGVLRMFSRSALSVEKSLTVSMGEYVWELLRLYDAREGEHLLAARISSRGKTVVVGYNDAFVAAAVGRASKGIVYRGNDVSLGGVAFRTHVMDFDSSAVDGLVDMRETGVKYLVGPAISGLLGADPRMLGFEVGLPTGFGSVTAGSYGALTGLGPNSKGLQIYVGTGPRPDLLGVLPTGRLLWVEVKNLDRLPKYPPEGDLDYLALKSEFLAVADRAQRLLAFIKDVGPSRASASLASVVAAFAGAGASGGGVSSAFVFSPVFTMPVLSGKDTKVVFVVVLFRGGRAVIYDAEVTLGSLADESFLGRIFDDAVAAFGSVEKVEKAADVQELVEAYVQALPLPK